jgi:hypothetical protein
MALRSIGSPVAMVHLASEADAPHKHLVDRLQIIFRREIHDGEIFVVEFLVLLDGVAVALNQVHEQILVRVHMAIEVHRHEAGQLQEPGIDETAMPAVRPGHRGDDRPPRQFVPFSSASLSTCVGLCRVSIGLPFRIRLLGRKGWLRASMSATADKTGTPG